MERTQKTKQRGNGQGSVYKLPNGKWQAAKTLGYWANEDGRLLRKVQKKSFAAKKDALKWLVEIENEVAARKSVTFKTLYDLWLPTHQGTKSTIDGYKAAAKEADLVISEIGIWNNLLETDAGKREANIQRAIHQLELADYVGANCCVNISGNCGTQWDGHHPDNLTQKTFDEVVRITQRIIDAVNPKNTEYTLEPMPWMFPHTADSYVELLKAVDRKGFAAHLDPVNV